MSTKILDELRDLTTKVMRNDHEARKQLADELRELPGRLARDPGLRAAREAFQRAIPVWEEASTAFRAAVARVEAAKRGIVDLEHVFEVQRGRLEAALRATASPAIGDFRLKLVNAEDSRQGRHAEPDQFPGVDLRARIAAFGVAIRRCDDLVFEALTDQALEEEFARLRASIPGGVNL